MKIYGLDAETYWDKDYTLRKLTTDGYIHDPRFKVHGWGIRWPDGKYDYVYRPNHITEAFAEIDFPRVAVMAHHAQFDHYILGLHYGLFPGINLCTMSMARAIHGMTVGASLDKAAAAEGVGYKGHEVNLTKGVRDLSDSEQEILGNYCINDTHLMWELWLKWKDRFTIEELHAIDLTVRMFTRPCLRLNAFGLKRFRDSILMRKLEMLDQLGVSKKELGSDAKFAELLMAMGIDPPTKVSPRTGLVAYAFAKSDPWMKEVQTPEYENDEVRWLVEARVGSKSNTDESRAARFLAVADDNRPWPVYLNYSAAGPGRWSGGNKQNPQNLRRGGILRDNIEAPPGHVIVVTDSAQIEARANAWRWGEKWLVDAFARGDDVYSMFASEEVYFRPVTKANVEERFVGKQCILGLGYGAGDVKFKLMLSLGMGGAPVVVVELEESGRIVTAYRRKNTQIVRGWGVFKNALPYIASGGYHDMGEFEVDEGCVLLPSGRRIQYPNLQKDGKGEWTYTHRKKRVKIYSSKGVENYIQGFCCDIVAGQMLRIDTQYRKRDGKRGEIWRVASMSHDEIISVVPEKHAEKALEFQIECMKVAPWWAKGLPLSAEGGFGRNYGAAK